MAFELLNELQGILVEERQQEAQTQNLFESVDKFLGHLHAVLSLKDGGGLDSVDTEELSKQLAALQLLGRKDDRDVLDDFAKLDASGVSKKFYQFLQQIDDKKQTRDFADKRDADELLIYIGETHAPSLAKEFATRIEAAKSGDEAAKRWVAEKISKMFTWYQRQYNALRAHFGAGGAFDDLVPQKEPTV